MHFHSASVTQYNAATHDRWHLQPQWPVLTIKKNKKLSRISQSEHSKLLGSLFKERSSHDLTVFLGRWMYEMVCCHTTIPRCTAVYYKWLRSKCFFISPFSQVLSKTTHWDHVVAYWPKKRLLFSVLQCCHIHAAGSIHSTSVGWIKNELFKRQTKEQTPTSCRSD